MNLKLIGLWGIISSLSLLFPSGVVAQAVDNLDQQLLIPGADSPLGPEGESFPGNTETGTLRNEADFLVRQGRQAAARGDYERAVLLWEGALDLYEQIRDDAALATAAEALGNGYSQLGQYAKAEYYIRRRLAVLRDLEDFRGQVDALNHLGTVLLFNQNLDGAGASFQQALDIAQSIDSQEGIALSVSNLGLLATREGQYAVAIKRYRRALEFRRRFNDYSGQANTLNNAGDTYQAWGKHDLALPEYRLARWYAQESNDLHNHFRALRGLSISYVKTGLLSPAFEALDEWVTLARATDNLSQELAALHLYAKYYAGLGERQQAQNLYNNAIAVAQRLEDEQSEAILRNELNQVIFDFPFGIPPHQN
ncbi:tetratricopeptide repeat protein [Spirulina sp. CS-785/01]|uniref:tetratricopeptide repeat protein n=1 Tax=Spirulina sp. CS-785/01 TaxID=3021716 RepID=UPI00232CD0A9|nr:tetratricopeptide repeat protein [Spirulina sp. CS-785/01]MDB9313735.1 tetratricopeptide repeat protein [Spirulina sp. CS-785/01]